MSTSSLAFRCLIAVLLLQLPSGSVAAQPEEGVASYYADRFQDRPTSTGEAYDKEDYTAASKTYPYGTVLEVTSLSSGNSVEVRVNDCGPHHPGRILDLSRAAARSIGLVRAGTAKVKVRVVELGDQGPTCHRSAWTRAEKRRKDRPKRRPGMDREEIVLAGTPPALPRDTVPAPAAPTPETQTGQTTQKEFAPDEMLFGVQVAAFGRETNARELVVTLQERGFSDAWTARVGKVYRVFTGKFYFQDEARELRDRVREAGFSDATVRRVQ